MDDCLHGLRTLLRLADLARAARPDRRTAALVRALWHHARTTARLGSLDAPRLGAARLRGGGPRERGPPPPSRGPRTRVARAGAGGRPRERRVPGHPLTRAAHAAQRRTRVDRNATHR